MKQDDTISFSEDRRQHIRYPVNINVNYRHGDTFLFSKTSNVSELGIFLVSNAPFSKGTELSLEFQTPGAVPSLHVRGKVMWVESGKDGSESGMGIQFMDLTPETRAYIRQLIRTMAIIED